MAALAAGRYFGQGGGVVGALRVEEALEVIGLGHRFGASSGGISWLGRAFGNQLALYPGHNFRKR